jgi:acetoin utilization deacetylase AcuC-like enzyme
MAASMRALADELDVPVGVVLEGGYDLEALAESTVATLEVIGGEHLADRRPVALHPQAAQAAGRLAGRWPLVGVLAS